MYHFREQINDKDINRVCLIEAELNLAFINDEKEPQLIAGHGSLVKQTVISE